MSAHEIALQDVLTAQGRTISDEIRRSVLEAYMELRRKAGKQP